MVEQTLFIVNKMYNKASSCYILEVKKRSLDL